MNERWPGADAFVQAAKVAEEAGEVVGAAIKERQSLVAGDEVLNELADTMIAAIGAIQAREHDPATVVAERWKEVHTR